MGGLPNVYPAYQAVNDPDIQKKFEAAWNAKLSDKVGLTIPGVLDGLTAGTVKAVYVVGENPMVSDPDVHHVEKALRAAELLVVQDIFLTPTAELAHVVLPGASFAEKDGTFSNTERRVQRVRKAIEPVGESRADWEILQDLSTRFGYPMKYESPAEIMAEVAQVAPSYGGITYDRLEGDGLFWPCVNKDHPGTKVLHQGKFSRGLGLFHAIDFKPPTRRVLFEEGEECAAYSASHPQADEDSRPMESGAGGNPSAPVHCGKERPMRAPPSIWLSEVSAWPAPM